MYREILLGRLDELSSFTYSVDMSIARTTREAKLICFCLKYACGASNLFPSVAHAPLKTSRRRAELSPAQTRQEEEIR